jgi:hypothetical protein
MVIALIDLRNFLAGAQGSIFNHTQCISTAIFGGHEGLSSSRTSRGAVVAILGCSISLHCVEITGVSCVLV